MSDDRLFPTRPLVGIAAVLFRADAVLLIRRGRAPLLGMLSFPGGGQELGETAEAAARRELAEETGMQAGAMHLAAHADVLDHDAQGRVRFHYTILHFAGEAAPGEPVAAGDAAEAFFVKLADLEAAGLDATHRAVVTRALGVRAAD